MLLLDSAAFKRFVICLLPVNSQILLLPFAGPKVEYLGVSVAMVSLLLIYWLTNSLAAFYVTSGVMGLSRAVLNTIPFMVANEQCQKEVSFKAKDVYAWIADHSITGLDYNVM